MKPFIGVKSAIPRLKIQPLCTGLAANDHVLFTHDLGFSPLLAAGGQHGPSVIQVRNQDVMPEAIGADVVRVLSEHENDLQGGAIITVDEMTSRLRILPIRRKSDESD